MKLFYILVAAFLSVPAFASITVTEPLDGDTLPASITLSASSSLCGNVSTTAMGYSFDDSPNTTIIDSQSIYRDITAPVGKHVLHVKCWGRNGAWGVSNLSLNVVSSKQVQSIQSAFPWGWNHDPAAGSGSSGTTSIISSPSLSGKSRRFDMSFTNNGGEIFYASFVNDTVSHFVYDAQVLLQNSSQLANIEMDLNQVLSNGQTVIFGVQCDGWSGTWDYTKNAGTATNPNDTWVHSNLKCSPSNWKVGAWHRVQISYSRDTLGNVHYDSVALDGVEAKINQTVFSSFALGWGNVLLTNFQLDGKGSSGSATAVVDNLSLYEW